MKNLAVKTQKKRVKKSTRPRFWEEFAAELDIFDSILGLPAWTFDYRDDLMAIHPSTASTLATA